MMLDQRTKAQLQVLDQAAGPEALVVWSNDLDDSDLAGFQEFLHGGLELAQVVTAQAARHANAGHSLRHVRQYLDHQFPFVAWPDFADALHSSLDAQMKSGHDFRVVGFDTFLPREDCNLSARRFDVARLTW
jgi:pyruvate dehydrogenase complex dehydrogenase (E1) component